MRASLLQVSGTPLLPADRGEAAGRDGAENGGAPGELGGQRMDRCPVLEDGHGTAHRVPPRPQVSRRLRFRTNDREPHPAEQITIYDTSIVDHGQIDHLLNR